MKRNNLELQEEYPKEIQGDKVKRNGYNRAKLLQILGRKECTQMSH
jgi:hypothetical protein